MKEIDFFDESLVAFEDWDSRIRYSAFAQVGYCDNVGSIYHVTDSGISKRTNKADLAIQAQKVFVGNIKLLNGVSLSGVKKKIRKRFLVKNFQQILHNTSLKERPFLHIATRLKYSLLMNNVTWNLLSNYL